MKIDGSVALGTGADRGLGQAFARALVRRGQPGSTGRLVIPTVFSSPV